ncbi:MAG: hypothetical protein AB7K09_06285 [Planctomycetota bacterium]
MDHEIVGYAACLLVAVSMLMTSLWSLRWVNLVGSATFTVYGVLIVSWPVTLTNAFIALVNVWFLAQLARHREAFSLVPVGGADDPWLAEFLRVHGDDVRRFEPGFAVSSTMQGVFILRNAVPAGLFVWEQVSEFEARICLDYVAPAWRDFRNAGYLYEQRANFLRQQGIWKLTAAPAVAQQTAYLKRFGFEQQAEGKPGLQLALDE